MLAGSACEKIPKLYLAIEKMAKGGSKTWERREVGVMQCYAIGSESHLAYTMFTINGS